MLKKSVKIVVAVWVLALSLWGSLGQAAHAAEGQSYLLQAGNYEVLVTIDNALLKTGSEIPFTVKVNSSGSVQNLTVTAEPFPGLSATPLHFKLKAQSSNLWQGNLDFPVSGNWYLVVQMDGSQGSQTARQNIVVAPPPALPLWLAWLLGLSPLIWFGLFFTLKGRQANRKLKRELALELATD